MPDDSELEVAEPQDPDAMAGFDEAASEAAAADTEDEAAEEKETATEEEPKEEAAEKEAEEKKPAKEEAAAEPVEKKEKEEEELTAKDRAEKRAEAYEKPETEETPAEEEGEDAAPVPPPSGAEPKVPSPSQLTKQEIVEGLKKLNVDEVRDVLEFCEERPEEANAMIYLINKIVENRESGIEEKLAGMDLVDAAALEKVQKQLDAYGWWDEVTVVHPDAKKLSTSKEFNAWLDKQRDGIKAMADGSPQDAIDVLDFYKEETAKANVAEHDDNARKKKKKKDDLHKGSLRGKQTVPKTEAEIATDDELAGWEAGLKDEND